MDRFARTRLGLTSSRAIRAVFLGWDELVGPAVAAHAQPRSLRDGVLVIVVDDGAWATELRFLTPDLLRRLGEVAGPDLVRQIDVSLAQ